MQEHQTRQEQDREKKFLSGQKHSNIQTLTQALLVLKKSSTLYTIRGQPWKNDKVDSLQSLSHKFEPSKQPFCKVEVRPLKCGSITHRVAPFFNQPYIIPQLNCYQHVHFKLIGKRSCQVIRSEKQWPGFECQVSKDISYHLIDKVSIVSFHINLSSSNMLSYNQQEHHS